MAENITAINLVALNPHPTGTNKNAIKGMIKQIIDAKNSHGKMMENSGTIKRLIINDNRLMLDENKAKNGKIVSWAEREMAMYWAIRSGINFLQTL